MERMGLTCLYQALTCRAVSVQLCFCKGFAPSPGQFQLSCPICRGGSMRNQRMRTLRKAHRACFAGFFLLTAFLPCYNHLELTFPKQRALGHLSAADDQWEVRASVLQGLLRSTEGPLGKETLEFGFCSAGFAELFFRLSAVSSSRVAAGVVFEQSWLPLALSLCADPAPLSGSQERVNSFPWQALQRD